MVKFPLKPLCHVCELFTSITIFRDVKGRPGQQAAKSQVVFAIDFFDVMWFDCKRDLVEKLGKDVWRARWC